MSDVLFPSALQLAWQDCTWSATTDTHGSDFVASHTGSSYYYIHFQSFWARSNAGRRPNDVRNVVMLPGPVGYEKNSFHNQKYQRAWTMAKELPFLWQPVSHSCICIGPKIPTRPWISSFRTCIFSCHSEHSGHSEATDITAAGGWKKKSAIISHPHGNPVLDLGQTHFQVVALSTCVWMPGMNIVHVLDEIILVLLFHDLLKVASCFPTKANFRAYLYSKGVLWSCVLTAHESAHISYCL